MYTSSQLHYIAHVNLIDTFAQMCAHVERSVQMDMIFVTKVVIADNCQAASQMQYWM